MSKKKQDEVKHKTSVGGQALIEGVMMRGPKGMGISVRTPDGTIDTEVKKETPIREKYPVLGWPLIRGIVSFVESMITGYRCLMISAEKSGMEELEEGEEEASKFEQWLTDKLGDKLMAVITGISAVLGFILAFLIFFWLPVAVFDGIKHLTVGEALMPYKGLIEGVLRIVIFVIYITLVSRMKQIHRLFEYHGAEHKTIFCYEHGLELTVENVRKQSRFHPRCGTSFLLFMLIVSIIVSSILSKVFPAIAHNQILWVILKLAFLPVIMGLGYEFIRYAGRHNNLVVRVLSAPGLWMQRLTTQEPSEDAIIEVGIAALQAVITENPEDDAL